MKTLFKITAQLTGLAYLEPEGKDWTDPSLAYNIKCTPDFMRLCMEEPCRHEKKGMFHIICECEDCGRWSKIGIRRQLGVPLLSGVETPVMLLECEGLVPLDGEVGTNFKWIAVSKIFNRSNEIRLNIATRLVRRCYDYVQVEPNVSYRLKLLKSSFEHCLHEHCRLQDLQLTYYSPYLNIEQCH
nr:hypothetical protein CFP56_02087 [Quercus suber]